MKYASHREHELIRCRFGSASETLTSFPDCNIDVYYGERQSFVSQLPGLANIISGKEKEYAGKLVLPRDMETYIISHAVLKLYLSRYLNLNPEEIIYYYSTHNKPGIENNPLYFNMAHTKEAFVIAVSEHCYVGADIEKITEMSDINSLVRFYFSKAEQDFIFGSASEREIRFFLLWTRKESLLKALGTGIVDDLCSIEVSGQFNNINSALLDSLIPGKVFNEHYIYSTMYNDNYISVAVPSNPVINFFHIHADDISGLLCK
jgi:4'-phosphopantetheinyl transferase